MSVDILITGTGMFAGRMALDIAATAQHPVKVMVAGRNTDRLDWLRTAGNARAAMFGTPAKIVTHEIDLMEEGASERILDIAQPRIVVQAASIQTSSVIAQKGSKWTDLVSRGGLSATAVFQAIISSRMARAIEATCPGAHYINCSFPDVVNGMISEMGYDVLCGTGNVAILSNVFEGAISGSDKGRLRVLAHYQNLAPWRQPADRRADAVPPRVFVGDKEVEDVFATFRDTRLTPEPAIEISGASGVTLMLALAANQTWYGHAPAPHGRPGGYPVKFEDGVFGLDLPTGVDEAAAVAWNDAFERRNGMTVGQGRAQFHGTLHEMLSNEGFVHADGFALCDLEEVHHDFAALRDRLSAQGST
ncbi:hypothetical protein [Roseovarius sp. D0-M9]|uniref:hypothetical protein n=1 Tax=Roseovarius sp. D0-M9 TaxID=3127117 RepID=UPI00300FA3ED